MVAMPIFVLFLQDNGLSMTQIITLQVMFSIIIVVAEIPSGYLADIISRKISIIIGLLLGFLAYVIYAQSYQFTGFLLAEMILGFGSSFLSGADSALLYDTLGALNREGEYKKYQGFVLSAENFSESIASILGGFLAVISLRLPFYIQALVMLLGLIVALTLKEPERQKVDRSEGNVKTLVKTIRYAMHDHPAVKWLIIYSAIVSASTFSAVWFIQPYFAMVGLPLALFGIVWAAIQFTTGATSLFAYKIENFLGKKVSLICLIFLPFFTYLLLGVFEALWAISFIFIFYIVRGFANPVFKDYVNNLIPSDTRATILSVQGLAMRLIFSIVGPFLGWIADLYSIQHAFFLTGILFLGLGIISLLFLKKHRVLSS